MAAMAARPKSMPDFFTLLDATTPIPENARPRKKPSISLAAGLIMASESQTHMLGGLPHTPQPPRSQSPKQAAGSGGEQWSDSLFYAYAQKSDYAQSPPYILTFANARICDDWWELVRCEYPESVRMGPQLFVLKGDDVQEQIQDNPKFYDLRNKWFYTASDGPMGSGRVIPLQDHWGWAVGGTTRTSTQTEKKPEETFSMKVLNDALDKMAAMISENSSQIQALSVAQSAGLQRMQEINETNSTQIKALAESQSKLQSLVSGNASQYIALSNSAFANQEQVKGVIATNAEQIKALVDGQARVAKTCEGMMRTIESLGSSVARVNNTIQHSAGSDTASSNATPTTTPFSAVGNRISPPPRKLNRRIKGVWYEYDTDASPQSSPRKTVAILDTPPKSPLNVKNA